MAFLLIFSLIRPAGAGFWDSFAGTTDWRSSPLTSDSDPVARDLVTWLTVTDTNIPLSAKSLINFSLRNSGWPRLSVFRARIEKDTSGLRPVDIAAWFDQNPPKTVSGIKAYVAALTGLQQGPKAKAALQTFWRDADLDKKETAALAAQYTGLLSDTDHAARLDNLLWEMRFQEAEAMLPLVSASLRKVAEARIALGRLSSKAPKLLKDVPAPLMNDNGLLFSRTKYRRAMNKDEDAFETLQKGRREMRRPDLWWKERNVLVRRALEKKNYTRAYQIIHGHGLTSGPDYAVAEWTLGWLELEYLGHPDKAYQHFDKFYQSVTSAVSRARAAYWLARAAEKMHQTENAANWRKIGAQFPSTFYGQICYEALTGGPLSSSNFPADLVTDPARAAFDSRTLVKAVRLLAQNRLQRFSDAFFTKLLDSAGSREDFILIAQLAKDTGRKHYAVEANKQMQMKIGEFMFTEGYPLLPPISVREPEKALIHAIVHRESMFNAEAQSPAGARGLMQLMPGTAKEVSRKLGLGYTAEKLTGNPGYNIELGSAYLARLVDNYDGFYPLAIAAYNAGPSNVAKWVKAFGDPRSGHVNLVNWIEQIPIYETRNYIQRVMESYYMYKLRLGEEPKTVLEFKK